MNNNNEFVSFIDKLSKISDDKEAEFLKRENELIEFQNEIDNLKKIYGNDELEKKIDEYNNKYSFFKSDVEEFNSFISKNLKYNRSIIIENIGNIAKIVSSQNNIDIIIESESYFLASESIDISQLIIEELNKNKIIFEILKE